MSINVLTRSFDHYRTGWNYNETVQTPAKLRANGIAHQFDCPLPGDRRGTEGSALIAADLTMRDGLAHDVLYVPSMSDDVRAFDAATGQLLWHQRVGNPIPGTRAMDMFLINDNWGILSTGVINRATGTLYVVAMTSATGQLADSRFFLHALSLVDGAHQAPPLNLNTAAYQAPGLTRVSRMGNVPRKQRCALLGDFGRNGVDTVFVANGSFNEVADTNQGWLIACDVTGLAPSVAAAWTTTSRFPGGGLWMGGQGPAMDDAGFLYCTSGNGGFDGVTDFGESMVKLRYTPKRFGVAASIVPVGWFTPFTDTGRVGADPTLADVSLIPGGGPAEPGGPSNMDSPGDEDLNSGGQGYIPRLLSGFSVNLAHVAGKDGIWYLVNADAYPQSKLADFAPARIAQNYAKLAMPPVAVTYFPDNSPIAPVDLSTMQTTHGGRTHHMHATPVVYKSPAFPAGVLLYFGGENGPVKAYHLTETTPGAFALTWLADGAEIASAAVPNPGGMPGTMITGSSKGATPNTGVLWCLQPYGNANNSIAAGRLIAYAADEFQNGAMVKLWDSEQWNVQFAHNKFDIPVCANGKVYVPTYDGRVMVWA